MRARQRGAGLLMAVILIVTVAAFAVIVAASQSGGDVRANDLHADSVQALYLAETGLERALKRFATGTACGAALAEAINDLSGLQTTGATINILAGLTTDFAGAPLASTQTQCRLRASATIGASGVSRTLHAIVDKNLLTGSLNFNFNNPTTAVPPSGWVLAPGGTYAQSGGPDGTAPACNRSAWIWKPDNGGGAPQRTVAAGTAPIPTAPAVTVANGSTTTVYFHWRAVNRTAQGACAAYPAGAPAFPCGGPGGNDAQICFELTSTAGGPWQSGRRDITPGAGGSGTVCPTAFNPCSSLYEVPNPPVYPTKDSLTIAHTANVTLNGLTYYMRLQNNGWREMFLDNIELVNPSALNAARIQVWRDCSSAADPVNCV